MAIRKRTWQTTKGEEKSAWIVDYADQNGVRRQKTFARKKDAAAWAVTAGHEVKQGIHTAASASITVAEAGRLWIADGKAEGLEKGTIVQRQQHINLHINPYLGSIRLSDLQAPRVQAFVDTLRDEGRSLAMRRKVLTSLKTMLSFAQSRGKVAQNAARGIKVKISARHDEREMAAGLSMPTKAELRTMIDKAPARWRPFIITAIFTGLRASELRGLSWEHVDLEEGVIHVRQRADAWRQIGSPKSKAGRRDIPLAPMVINTLKEWRLSCPRRDVKKDGKGNVIDPGALDLVFPNGLGRVESHANIWKRVFAPLQMENGMTAPKLDDDGGPVLDDNGEPVLEPKYSLHALRHAAASLFIEQGWTPKKIQAVLGHASIQLTFDLYGKLFKDSEGDRAAMERMQTALLAG